MAGNGGLTKAQNALLERHLNSMVKLMDLGAVLDLLVDENVINPYFKSDIMEMDRSEQTYELFKLLKQRGNRTFKLFHEALELTGHSQLVELIDQHAPLSDTDETDTDFFAMARKLSRGNSLKKDKPTVTRRPAMRDEEHELRMNVTIGSLPQPSLAPSTSSYISKENLNQANIVSVKELATIFDDDAYHMRSSPKGNVLIINNMNFNTMPYRDGSSKDEDNLRKLFDFLDYRVHAHKNLTALEMAAEIKSFALLEDHRNRSSAIVVILSHGETGVIYGTDDEEINEHKFVEALNAKNAPLLAGKPKVFLMQACRGDGKDRGFPVQDHADGNVPSAPGDRAMREKNHNDGHQLKLPIEADILVCRSTPQGYVSWRNSRDGTWFIQALCAVFLECAEKEEVMTLLTKVNNRVSSHFESSKERCKQISEISSRLRKKLYFFPRKNGNSAVAGRSSLV